jgi:hypothetical protein
VRCEACHGPGSLHVEAVSQGQPERSRRLIQNPKRMSGPEINEFCGRCHRSPQDEALTDWDKAWNVRHQPIYLAQSACFLKSQGALSCLTCHNLHQTLDHDSASYDRKCVGCHKFVKHPLESEYRATTNCVECHMPRVSPQSYIEFTNHFIGVYSKENKLRPQP